MAEYRDPAIKLFGKTLQVPMAAGEACSAVVEKASSNKESRDKNEQAHTSPEGENKLRCSTDEENTEPNSSSPNKILKADDQQNKAAANNPQDKTHKNPDKILPCPRCNSMDTKFCYYNNYNVNQPRYFCKNCQRYWTAGGSMRNVPVGAGRRKSKSSAANHHYPHIVIPNCGHPDHHESIHQMPLKPNVTVLSFGSNAPLCDSMASVLNLEERTMKNRGRNGFHQADNGEDQSSGSSVTASSSNDESNGLANSKGQGLHPNFPYFNGTPWPYPWNHPPPFFPFFPVTAYWGMPWLSPLISTSPITGSSCSGSNSLTLGKHLREGHDSSKHEKSLWFPKTLRIDDPEKAAECSVWATLGFKNDKADSIAGDGVFFKALQSNGNLKPRSAEASHVLQANPAGLSRSISFQESS